MKDNGMIKDNGGKSLGEALIHRFKVDKKKKVRIRRWGLEHKIHRYNLKKYHLYLKTK